MADFRTFDPCNLLAPVPAVMVSCRAPEADAKPNIVTVAWVGTVNSEPPMMSISVRGNRFSHDLIAKSGEFVVNLVDEAHCKALDFCGVRSGRDVDKWQECHLTPMPALNMDYAPAIAECPAYLACKVVQQLELGSHTMFVGKIVGVQVRGRPVRGGRFAASGKGGAGDVHARHIPEGGGCAGLLRLLRRAPGGTQAADGRADEVILILI